MTVFYCTAATVGGIKSYDAPPQKNEFEGCCFQRDPFVTGITEASRSHQTLMGLMYNEDK